MRAPAQVRRKTPSGRGDATERPSTADDKSALLPAAAHSEKSMGGPSANVRGPHRSLLDGEGLRPASVSSGRIDHVPAPTAGHAPAHLSRLQRQRWGLGVADRVEGVPISPLGEQDGSLGLRVAASGEQRWAVPADQDPRHWLQPGTGA